LKSRETSHMSFVSPRNCWMELFQNPEPLIRVHNMGEFCDVARMIQRVIDPQYPNTRILWQGCRPAPVSRLPGVTPFVMAPSSTPSTTTFAVTSTPSLTRSRGVTAAAGRASYDPRYTPGSRTRELALTRPLTAAPEPTITADDEAEQLDLTIQRIVDQAYPETRAMWRRSRQDPTYLETRNLTYGTRFDVPA
jgi:hypothetical protein